VASDTELLLAYLDTQREHVLGILEGLSDDQLRASLLPSGWTSLGLVRHLTFDVEHYWVQCIVAGDSLDFFKENDLDDGAVWSVTPTVTSAEIFADYRQEWEKSNETLRRVSFDAAPAQRDEWWGEWKVPDVRFVVLHMIEETACHAGHLDVVRELIDGRQWLAF
jgi:Protein of unknown function (DUF664)